MMVRGKRAGHVFLFKYRASMQQAYLVQHAWGQCFHRVSRPLEISVSLQFSIIQQYTRNGIVSPFLMMLSSILSQKADHLSAFLLLLFRQCLTQLLDEAQTSLCSRVSKRCA